MTTYVITKVVMQSIEKSVSGMLGNNKVLK